MGLPLFVPDAREDVGVGTPAKARAGALVLWMSERRRVILIIAVLVIVRLWFADALDVRAIRSPNDDELYVSHAMEIRDLRWLGDFDHLTLVKGPGYPIYLAIVSVLPIPLLVVEHALYLLSGAVLAIALWPVADRRLLGAGYCLFAVNPLLFGEQQTQLSRDLFYSSMTMVLLGALTGMIVRRKGPAPGLAGWGLIAGLALSVLAITREDTIWVVPTVLIALAVVGHARLKRRQPGGRSLIAAYLVTVVPLVITLGAVVGVSTVNQVKYGVPSVIDTTTADYADAIGALLRVEGADEIDFVPLPADARGELAETVPSYGEIAPFVDAWVGTGCPAFAPACDDLTSAHFEWAVRDGVKRAGHYGSADEANAFFRLLADEVDTACADGRLRCRSGAGSLLGDLDGDDVAAVAGSFGEAFRWLVRPDPPEPNDRRGNLPRSPDLENVVNRDWVEVGLAASEIRLFGWVHDVAAGASDPLSVVVVPSTGETSVVDTARLDSPDVAAVLGDPGAGQVRFDVTLDCGSRCEVIFRYGSVDAMTLQVDGREPPVVTLAPGALAAVDFSTRGPQQRFLQDARLAVIGAWLGASDLLFAALLIAAVAVAVVYGRRRGFQLAGLVGAAVLVVAIGSRLATVAVVDALLFEAIRPSYLLPAGVALYALPMALSAIPRRLGARRTAP